MYDKLKRKELTQLKPEVNVNDKMGNHLGGILNSFRQQQATTSGPTFIHSGGSSNIASGGGASAEINRSMLNQDEPNFTDVTQRMQNKNSFFMPRPSPFQRSKSFVEDPQQENLDPNDTPFNMYPLRALKSQKDPGMNSKLF